MNKLNRIGVFSMTAIMMASMAMNAAAAEVSPKADSYDRLAWNAGTFDTSSELVFHVGNVEKFIEQYGLDIEFIKGGCPASSDGNHHWKTWKGENEDGVFAIRYECTACGETYWLLP